MLVLLHSDSLYFNEFLFKIRVVCDCNSDMTARSISFSGLYMSFFNSLCNTVVLDNVCESKVVIKARSDFHALIHDIEQCVDSVGSWMTGNRLKLTNDKTEALVVGSRRRVSVSQDSHFRVGSRGISFKSHVKSLGVYLTRPCLWQSILTTLVVQRILRSKELALFAIS